MEKTDLAVRSKLPKALEMLDERLSKIKAVTETAYKTSGEFKWNPEHSTQSVKIQNVIDIALLISIYAFFMNRTANYSEAAAELGLKEYPICTWQGNPIDDWKEDIKLRIAVVSYDNEKKKLEHAKRKLEGFLTQEDQLGIVLKELGLDSISI